MMLSEPSSATPPSDAAFADDEDMDQEGNQVFRQGPYATVENPGLRVTSSSSVPCVQRPSTWIKVLALLVVALVVDVLYLTIRVEQEESPASSSSTTASTSWSPLPSPDTVLSKLAFGSCANQHLPQPSWDTIEKYNPDLTVLMGDNVYGDCKDDECTILRQAYADWAALPSFQGAKQNLPMVATLDDHDYAYGDCDSSNPYKYIAKEMFLDFFNIQDERRSRTDDGVFKEYTWGPLGQRVQLILLDTRFQRSPFLATDEPHAPRKELYMPDYNNTTKRMLSDNQWKWLERKVKKPANIRLVVSSIQVLSEGTGFECWRMLPYERDRLANLLLNHTQDTLTFLLSGDRHVGGFYQYKDLIEVTASSWTHTMPFGAYDNCTNSQECDEVDERRLDVLVRDNHFASLDLDWENRTCTLGLRHADSTPGVGYRLPYKKTTRTNAGELIQSHQYNIP